MNELAKRKKEIDEEFSEIMEMEDDAINTRSKMTIAAVGKLLQILNEYAIDIVEIAKEKKYYDENLTSALQTTVSQLISAFSQIQPPIINVSPQLKFDISLLNPVLNKLGDQNSTLINLVSKYNNNQNENLLKLITSLVEKQILFLERDTKQINNTSELKEISEGVNKNNRVSKLLVVRGEGNLIIEVVPVYELKTKK